MRVFLILACTMLAATSRVSAQTAEQVEATLNQAFRNTPDPMSESDWSNVAGERISQTYEIQKGDTLWDISVTFFGNGFYWPKVWQLNGDIPNPHEISPGRVLRFTSGTVTEPPRLTLEKDAGSGKPEEPPMPVAEVSGSSGGGPTAADEPAEDDGPILPPPPANYRKVLKEIPPSFKTLESYKSSSKYDENGFNLEREPPKPERPRAVASTLVADEVPSAIGKIREFEQGSMYGQLNQKVFIRSLDIQTGDKLSVYNVGDEIKSPKSGEYQGRALTTAGEIEVIGRVGAQEDLYEGVITSLVDFMGTGSLLLKGPLPRFDYSMNGKPAQVDGRIVGGEGEQRNRVYGNQNIVFVNVGKDNGLKEGMIFNIYKGYRSRGKPDLEGFTQKIGTLKIIRTTEQRATAVILSTDEPIIAGDLLMKTRVAAVMDEEKEDDVSDERRSVEGPEEDDAGENSDEVGDEEE